MAEAIVCLSTYSGGVFHCQYFGNYPFVPFCSTFATRTFAGYLGPIGRSCFYYLVHIPFLRAIMVKKNHSVEFITLWNDNRVNRGPLVSTVVFRVAVSVLFVMFVITRLFKASVGLMFGVALLLVILMILSRQLKKQSILIERKFFQNLRSRDIRAEYLGEKTGLCRTFAFKRPASD